MSDDKTPLEEAVDQAVEAFVYAPIGLIFDGPAVFPDLVERGRNQVNVARMMGQMAVQTGSTELSKRLTDATTQAPGPLRDALSAFGLVRNDKTTAPAEPSAADNSPAEGAKSTAKLAARGVKTAAKGATSSVTAATAAAAAALSIPEYDSLSASQVVQRLRGLAPEELEAVKAYEASNRARKTILNKIAQLQKA